MFKKFIHSIKNKHANVNKLNIAVYVNEILLVK